MKLEKLGYSQKWIDYGFLTEEKFKEQLVDFTRFEDKKAEEYRLSTFEEWIKDNTVLNITEIEQFMELAKEDSDQLMAGTALKSLFTSSSISDSQFIFLKRKLPAFGEWTKKFIMFTDLTKKLEKEVSPELYLEALKYKNQFRDSRLLVTIIKNTEDVEILADFESNGCGKQLRTMAEKRLNKVLKEQG